MKKFTSVDELFEDMEKNYTPWHRFVLKHEWLRWLIYNAKDVPHNTYRKIKRGWQRAYWGLADEDVWELDYYLSRVILRGLKKLKENKQGCPCLDGYDSTIKEESEAMFKEWDMILDSMIWTFEATRKIQQNDWLMSPEKGFNVKEMVTLSKNFHVMTVEEMNRYKEGWLNFQKYYFSLWD
jgi:hypothetical protein